MFVGIYLNAHTMRTVFSGGTVEGEMNAAATTGDSLEKDFDERGLDHYQKRD